MRIARIVFARLPEAGRVKSRLAAELTQGSALAIYRWLLRVQSRVLLHTARSAHSYSDYIYYAPRASRLRARLQLHPHFKNWRLRYRAQCDGDLGARLAHACGEVLRTHDMVCVWGADIPCLPDSIFETATALYPQSVITLARDGGYAFLSLAAEKFAPAVFSNIRWSTASTGADQLRALKRAGVSVTVRGRVTDLDRAKDFTRVLRELESAGRTADIEDLTQTIEQCERQ